MDERMITALAKGMVPFVRECVAEAVAPFAARLAEIEARPCEKGDTGELGPPGAAGAEGPRGQDGRPGRRGPLARRAARAPGPRGEQGHDGRVRRRCPDPFHRRTSRRDDRRDV